MMLNKGKLRKYNNFDNSFKIAIFLTIIFIIAITSFNSISDVNSVDVADNIQGAINNASSNDELRLTSSLYTGNNNKNLNINKNLIINGTGSGATIDAGDSGRIINSISSGVTLTIINVTFKNANPGNNHGGAIYSNNGALLI